MKNKLIYSFIGLVISIIVDIPVILYYASCALAACKGIWLSLEFISLGLIWLIPLVGIFIGFKYGQKKVS